MAGTLPIFEDHFGKNGSQQQQQLQQPDGVCSSRDKVADSTNQPYKPAISPGTKKKIRSTFYGPSSSDQNNKFEVAAAQPPSPSWRDRNMSIVYHLLSTNEAEYCDFINLSVAVGTYNVNGQFPSESLTPWLSSSDIISSPPDVYAIGFQELDLSQQAFLFDSTPREHDWADRVKSCLHLGATYAELRRIRLIGMFLLVYIKKQLLQHVDARSVDAVTVGTGLLNRMGNKGGVAVRFQLHDTTICFVNTHLAAGNDELQRRNQDYREISKIKFFQYASANSSSSQSPVGIFDHDMVFWLGDLNYRLQHTDPSLSVCIHEVRKACETESIHHLIPFDQLCQMQDQCMAFHEFKEGPVTFLPTYKYDPGTDNWDSSEKCRVPAWCDRILYAGERISDPSVYTSVPRLRISDHKPVVALFAVQVKHIDAKRYARFYEKALREADRLENEWLPTVSIDKAEFVFNDVKYLEPQAQTLTVKNTGQIPVHISFTPKPNCDTFCKRWLLVTPISHTIKVGGECVLDFQILMDKEAAWDLNAGRDKLEDILVLHLEKGKDYFISVSGTYIPSCFGRSLEALVGLTHPVRGVPVAQLVDLGPDINNCLFPPAVQLPVPKELWRLIDHIVKHGLDEPDLFGQAGSHAEFIAIRESLDSGYPDVIPGSVYSAVEALLRFLESLAESVIPTGHHTDRCLRSAHDWVLCKQAIDNLSPACHKNVFVYLIKFLKEVMKHSDRNDTNANALAMIFAPMIFRLDSKKSAIASSLEQSGQGGGSTTSANRSGKYENNRLQIAVQFLVQFLTHEYDG